MSASRVGLALVRVGARRWWRVGERRWWRVGEETVVAGSGRLLETRNVLLHTFSSEITFESDLGQVL